ncbi:MAG TPA: DUF4229 domain-containing protein [Kineosporiaceae bacterium]|nr:DUF4229 domain-containing protein [Kineosporiaceae bacterium]
MHLALIKYSVLRLALFVGSLIVLYAVGVRQSILMLVLAAGISLALSYLLLGKQRDAVAQGIAERINSRLEHRQGLGQSDEDAEDADVAASQRRAQGQDGAPQD